jgi:hypothetical protein
VLGSIGAVAVVTSVVTFRSYPWYPPLAFVLMVALAVLLESGVV